jgi:hypothetical protein
LDLPRQPVFLSTPAKMSEPLGQVANQVGNLPQAIPANLAAGRSIYGTLATLEKQLANGYLA